MKKTKETKQYSNQKFVCCENQAPRTLAGKKSGSKLLKVKLAKPQCHILNKIKCQHKTVNNSKKLLFQIDNFQFNKGRANKTIVLRRMLGRNMLEFGDYIHCEKDKKN